MAAWRSAPRGDRQVGAGAWVVAILGTWAVPALLGLGLAGLGLSLGRVTDGAGWALALVSIGWVLAFSPLLSWVGLLALAPLFWLLLRGGRAGWASAMAAGAVASLAALAALSAFGGGMAALIVLPFGIVAALILRGVLGWLAPEALAARPASQP